VTDALNAADPIPPGASSLGTGQFFIGYVFIEPTVVAVGGESIQGAWDICETECTDGVAILDPFPHTFAKFREVAAPGVVQVFTTKENFPPDFGGLADGDAICKERAETAGLSGTWTAWLSDSTGNAVDRIPDGEYRLLDGTVIADDKADLTFGLLKTPINVNERGEPQGDFAWTGTSPDGTDTGTNCSDWTNDLEEADFGVSSYTGRDWTSNVAVGFAPTSCNQGDLKLYCFGGGQ